MRAPGIYLDVPEDEYFQRELGVASNSTLVRVGESLKAYKAWVDGELPNRTSKSLEFGKAFHAAVLEPEKFEQRYAVQPDFSEFKTDKGGYGVKYKAEKAAWENEHGHKIEVTRQDYDAIYGMIRSLQNDPDALELLGRDGHTEVTLVWKDEQTGLTCKSRVDRWLPKWKIAVDIKSADDVTPDEFSKSVARYHYHTQNAMYRDGFRANGKPISHYYLVVVEKDPIHEVGVFDLTEEAVEIGYALYRARIERLAAAVQSGSYPGKNSGLVTLGLPRWYKPLGEE